MNDLGLEKPIEQHAKIIQDQSDDKESDDAVEEEQAYLAPRLVLEVSVLMRMLMEIVGGGLLRQRCL